MKNFERRLSRLESESSMDAGSRTLTDGEKFWIINCVLCPGVPQAQRITGDDLVDADFLFGGRFPWRSCSKVRDGDFHLWYMQFQNRFREEEKKNLPRTTAEDHHYLEVFERYWKKMGVLS